VRRTIFVISLLACSCGDGALEGSDRGAEDATSDTSRSDTRVADTESVDTTVEPPKDTGTAEIDSSAADTAPDGPCKTTCGGAECGHLVPNGCGGTIDCGDCSMPGEICVTITPLFRNRVRDSINALKALSPTPSYLDLADTLGESVRVLDTKAFTTALVSQVNAGGGVVCISDPADINEIRVRSSSSSSAENYHVVTSAGYSAYKYTSTCTPAGF